MKKALLLGIASLMTLGLASCGSDGKTPYIGDNGNWWIDSSDLGVPAKGEDGKDGSDGKDGKDGADGKDGKDGKDGIDGKDGTSVTVTSIEKTSSEGLVDTYTITFSDGTRTLFTVTNGESNAIVSIELTASEGNVDTYTITFTNGSTKTFTVTNGVDGHDLTITSIELKSSEHLIDTYVINYSDGSKFEFVVSNGADGQTPYIGDNGNWWIGNEDTGVLADWEKGNNVPLTIYSNGLKYETMTLAEKSGYVVTGWDDHYLEDSAVPELIASGMTEDEAKEQLQIIGQQAGVGHLVIPNYIGSVPVIGVWDYPGLNFGKITLSRNTVFLGKGAFKSNDLTEIDFNNANITYIPYEAFSGTKLEIVNLPSSVKVIQEKAFYDVKLKDFDFSNITYVGSYAFSSIQMPYVYLTKDVKYVGTRAFYSTRVYLEHETYPDDWPTEIASEKEINGRVSVNCKTNDEYMYSVSEEEATVYQYLGSEKKIDIPSAIEGKPVTKVGYGFATRPTEEIINVSSYEEINGYISLEEVALPDGIKEIDDFALCGLGLTVFAPSSLEKISETLTEAISEDDFSQISVNGTSIYAVTNYLALKSNDMPLVTDPIGHGVEAIYTKEYIEAHAFRVGFGIDHSKVESDDKFYYLNEDTSYSLLAYKGLKGTSLSIPSTFNEKPVLTILGKAIGFDSSVAFIKIENGVVRIRPYGICSYKASAITIPLSVLAINANGVCCSDTPVSIYAAAPTKPMDWDSNWTNRLDKVMFGVDGEISRNKFFVYTTSNQQISLISYLGSSSNVYVPETIDGLPVTRIKTGFYTRNGGAEIYIPQSITRIEANAFVNSSNKQFKIQAQAATLPDGWDSNWYYSNYSNNNSSYATKSWSQTSGFGYEYSEDYAYMPDGNEVTLLSHCGNSTFVNVPRAINDKTVTGIKGYCFYFTEASTINIPSEVETIEQYGIEFYCTSYKYLTVNCEAPSKPSGWDAYFACNTYYGSTSYINIYYGKTLNY